MFAFIVIAATPLSGVSLNDVNLFNHITKEEAAYHRILSQKHKNIWSEAKNKWREHLERILPEAEFIRWQQECAWRYECWDKLDDIVNAEKHKFGVPKIMGSLSKLRRLLGDDYARGRMPDSTPQYKVEWLHFLWTPESGFQGRLNNLQGVLPTD